VVLENIAPHDIRWFVFHKAAYSSSSIPLCRPNGSPDHVARDTVAGFHLTQRRRPLRTDAFL
jgi:hypothetical protein